MLLSSPLVSPFSSKRYPDGRFCISIHTSPSKKPTFRFLTFLHWQIQLACHSLNIFVITAEHALLTLGAFHKSDVKLEPLQIIHFLEVAVYFLDTMYELVHLRGTSGYLGDRGIWGIINSILVLIHDFYLTSFEFDRPHDSSCGSLSIIILAHTTEKLWQESEPKSTSGDAALNCGVP